MVNILRRFSQPLMVILTVMVIIAFAWWGPNLNSGGRSREAALSAYGRTYSHEDVTRIHNRLEIHAVLGGDYIQIVEPMAMRSGTTSGTGVVNSIVIEHEADALGLTATDDEIWEATKGMRAFQDREGNFDESKLTAFVQNVMAPKGYSSGQLSGFIAREVQVGKIRDLIGATVGVTPSEVREKFAATRLKTEASYVAFSELDFLKDVQVPEDDVKKRYQDQIDVLKSEELRTVEFAAFLLPPPEDGKPLETEKRTELLQGLANKAYDLATKLAERDANFAELAKESGATVGATSEWFSISDEPEDLEESIAAAKAAFELTVEKPFSKHIVLQKGVYVLKLKGIKPPETKTFENSKAELTATMNLEKARDLARAKANETLPKFAEAKAAGKSFFESAEALGLKPVAFPAFTRPQSLPPPRPAYSSEVVDVTKNLAPGEFSDVIPTAKGALIVHLDQRPAVDEKGFDEAKPGLIQSIRSMREYLLFNGWITSRRAAAGLGSSSEES